jgi:hypothetical protein
MPLISPYSYRGVINGHERPDRLVTILCSVTGSYRLNEAGATNTKCFDINEQQVWWVTTAKAGEAEDGSAEALVGIDQEGWLPVRIRASGAEAGSLNGSRGSTVR